MMTFHTCDIMIMMMKKIWFHEINDSLSRSLSPFTHSVQLQSGLTRQVSQFSNCLLGFMQGPVKIVWIGRWGISCDFSAPLPRRCVCMYAGGSRCGTLPRWINGGRWLDRAMVTYISGALSNYLTWARLRREREEARCSPADTCVYVVCSLNSWEMLCAQPYISCRACPKSQPCLAPSTGVSCTEMPI